MLKRALTICSNGKKLSEREAYEVMNEMMAGHAKVSQISALLSMLRVRGETIDEMIGFAKSMKEHSITVQHPFSKLIDTCGTGGDELSTFNISTATAIVLSAMNIKVAKHGNRAISSSSGSADVLETLQIPFQTTPIEALQALHSKNLCFLFAPAYHQSMKHVANTRKELGFKTVFNLLGPLVNPANASYQMIGVFNTEYAEKMAITLRELGAKNALFVTGGDGMDECSITTYTDVVELRDRTITRYRITPEQFGLERGNLQDLMAKDCVKSAQMIQNLLQGNGAKSVQQIVALNAGAALYIADEVDCIQEGVLVASKIIKSKQAYEQFKKLKEENENHVNENCS